MQRIFNVDRWLVIEPGQLLEYPSPRPRLVRVEVNSTDAANLFLINSDQEAFHLARVCGRDTIEFVSPGPFSLSAADGPISVYTVDGTSVAHTVEAPKSFTTIVERRQRSPELDYIARLMSANMERRLSSQVEELEAQYRRREREREAKYAAIAKGASLPGDAPSEPAPADHVEVSGSPEAPPGSGTGSKRAK